MSDQDSLPDVTARLHDYLSTTPRFKVIEHLQRSLPMGRPLWSPACLIWQVRRNTWDSLMMVTAGTLVVRSGRPLYAFWFGTAQLRVDHPYLDLDEDPSLLDFRKVMALHLAAHPALAEWAAEVAAEEGWPLSDLPGSPLWYEAVAEDPAFFVRNHTPVNHVRWERRLTSPTEESVFGDMVGALRGWTASPELLSTVREAPQPSPCMPTFHPWREHQINARLREMGRLK